MIYTNVEVKRNNHELILNKQEELPQIYLYLFFYDYSKVYLNISKYTISRKNIPHKMKEKTGCSFICVITTYKHVQEKEAFFFLLKC